MTFRTDIFYRHTGKMIPNPITSGRFDTPEWVPVNDWCVPHGQEPIYWDVPESEPREFCSAGTEEDMGGFYEWDCFVVSLRVAN